MSEASNSENSLPSQDISRRKFLTKTGKTFIGAGVGLALSHIEARRASSTEVKVGMAWKEGIEALMKDVFESPVETQALYLKKKDGDGRFVYSYDGTIENTEGIKIEALPVEVMAALQTKPVSEVLDAHPHTLSGIVAGEGRYKIMSSAMAEEMKQGLRPLVSLPPSILDINRTADSTFFKYLKAKNIKFTGMVADPRGLWFWEYKNDPEIEKEKIEDDKIKSEWSSMMRNRLQSLSQEDIDLFNRMFLQSHGYTTDEVEKAIKIGTREGKYYDIIRFLRHPLQQKELVERLFGKSPEQLPLYEKGLARYQKDRDLDIDKCQYDFAKKSLQGEVTSADYETLTKAYKYNGAVLTFAPYHELGLSYRNLHKKGDAPKSQPPTLPQK